MKLLFDFFPIVLFFIVYKFFGIYTATAVAMVASVTQVAFYRLKFQHYEKCICLVWLSLWSWEERRYSFKTLGLSNGSLQESTGYLHLSFMVQVI